jgi:hypothetical protein
MGLDGRALAYMHPTQYLAGSFETGLPAGSLSQALLNTPIVET